MKPEYERVRFFDNADMGLSRNFEKAKSILANFDENQPCNDINDSIELYNIYQIFTSGGIKEEYTQPYSALVRKIKEIASRFFQQIDDHSFKEQYKLVCRIYIDDFWELFERVKLYERISSSTIESLLEENKPALYSILKHKKIVLQYDSTLAECMRQFRNTGEILIRKYLEKKDFTPNGYYIPPSLKTNEFEPILNKYIESEDAHIGLLQLLASSQSSKEFPLTDELRLKAKKQAAQYWKDRSSSGPMIQMEFSACFADSERTIVTEEVAPFKTKYIYDSKWIQDNLDFPTLLNNFIYLFNYTNLSFQCLFPSIKSELGAFESAIGVKGVKEYETGSVFWAKDLKSSVEMDAYIHTLSQYGIHIEDVYKWFFTEYLKDEFGVTGFVFNGPSENQSFLEKCRTLPSEMDGIFKQYRLYAQHNEIDRELLEMSSKPISFETLPSMTKNKYAYSNSTAIMREQHLMFSDQTLLGYFPDQDDKYETFFDALSAREIHISDYPEWELGDIQWLKERNVITTSSSGVLQMNKPRVKILRDLYEYEVVCASHYIDKTEIEKLVSTGDLRYESSLFSIPEQHYLNFMLNKAEYSNGLDLRNKYIHSTYPLDECQQEQDYLRLLKIMAVVIIKINEEFCLKFPPPK